MKRYLVKVWIPHIEEFYLVPAENNIEAMEKALAWFQKTPKARELEEGAIASVIPEIA